MSTLRDKYENARLSLLQGVQRETERKWLRSWHIGDGYSHEALAESFRGFTMALETHIGIQEAWEHAGGNPGIKATREELISALRALDEACDEDTMPLTEVWNALVGDSSLETPTLSNVRTLLTVVRSTMVARKRMPDMRGSVAIKRVDTFFDWRSNLPNSKMRKAGINKGKNK